MGVDGAVGHVVEYAGPAIEALSMEGRMTICNMTIEGGGRAGHDRARRDDVRLGPGPPAAPTGADFDAAVERWRELRTDDGRDVRPRDHGRRRRALARRSPGARTPAWSSAVTERVPAARRATATSARSSTWACEAGTPIEEIRSTACSSARARTRASATCAPPPRWSRATRSPTSVYAMVVPGSVQVKAQAEAEGLDEVFTRRRLRLARRRLLDVPGHEPRHR